MIPIAKPLIGDEEKNAVMEVLESGIIAQGPKVAEFEKAFAEFIGTKHAVAVNSGTAALHAALLAEGIGAGDEVITTPFSFIATGNSILYTGAKPVFADIEEDTFNIDPAGIEEKITDKTKAIMPVHLYGHPADMRGILKIARDYDLAVIEDACQAHGAVCSEKMAGSFGTGCFSFYPTKNMTTSEGGMITTDDDSVAENARLIRAHGSSRRYYHDTLGFNLRMTDIQAAIGLCQLKKLPGFNDSRIENARVLNELIENPEIITPVVRWDCTHVFHQYSVRKESGRKEVFSALEKNKIGYGVYYPVPIHCQKLYLDMGYCETLPVSERLAEEVFSLPVHPGLEYDDLARIASVLNDM